MSNALGDRRGSEHGSSRVPPPVARAQTLAITRTDTIAPPPSISSCVRVPRGLLPVLMYMAIGVTIPVVWFYKRPDYTERHIQVATIGLSALFGVLVILANDCCCWYNLVLAFHTGLQAKVVDVALDFARKSSTKGEHEVLAVVGACVVIAHLVPFYVYDNLMVLSLVAYAGLVVNVSILVYLEAELLLLIGTSCVMLLMSTMLISGVCDVKTSLFSLVRDAFVTQSVIKCDTFEL